MPYVLIAWLLSLMLAALDPFVLVCESDGEIVSARDVRDGQRIDDGCYVHRMRLSVVCSIAECP